MNNELANVDTALDHFERVAAQESSGTVLKYVKGEWLVNDAVQNGKKLIAEIDRLAFGWRKWRDSKIIDTNMGFVMSGFQSKKREEFDELEGSTWAINKSGGRDDPWQEGYLLRLRNGEGEIFVYSATSVGGRHAIGDLINAYVYRRRQKRLGGLPIVELGTRSYPHKEYGRVNEPTLRVVDWTADDTEQPLITAAPTAPAISPPASALKATTDDIIDDDIPF